MFLNSGRMTIAKILILKFYFTGKNNKGKNNKGENNKGENDRGYYGIFQLKNTKVKSNTSYVLH